jgi:hypothetical protein
MKVIGAMLFVFVLAACERPQPIDTAESLAKNPERLQEVQRRCKEGSIAMAACRAASDAVRQQFQGNGQPNYTPTSPPKE